MNYRMLVGLNFESSNLEYKLLLIKQILEDLSKAVSVAEEDLKEMRSGPLGSISQEDVEWIVYDEGDGNYELGVKIGEKFFTLYKGESIQREQIEGTRYRHVGKREFGEVIKAPRGYAHAQDWVELKKE